MMPSLFSSTVMVTNVLKSYVTPAVLTLSAFAALVSAFFLITGGIQYMSSTGDPARLENAKKTIRNAIIGLVLVLAAATLTSILSNAYGNQPESISNQLPALQEITTNEQDKSFGDLIVKGIVSLLRNIVDTAAEPFLGSLSYFVNGTQLMAQNASVFNLWLAIVGMTDILFVLVVALLGFHIMSFSTFGFEELEIKHLLPRLGLAFLLINSSIFVIDALIGLSNIMIYALQSGFPSVDIWAVLTSITKQSSEMGVVGLLVMVAFLILSIMLLLFYLMRLVALYIGAILSPLVILLWLIPAFKDFAITALKTYLATIFVLFVHAVIMILAASILTGIDAAEPSAQPNALMAMMVGLATILTLLKTQSFLQEVSTVASVPRAAREMSGSFIRSVGYMNSARKGTAKSATKNIKRAKKVNTWNNKRKIKKETKNNIERFRKLNANNRLQGRSNNTGSKTLKTGETQVAPQVNKRGDV